jgi:hypothetical protein
MLAVADHHPSAHSPVPEHLTTLTSRVAPIFSGSNAGTPSGKSPIDPSARREAQKRRNAMELSATSKLHQTNRTEGHMDRAVRPGMSTPGGVALLSLNAMELSTTSKLQA